MPSCIRTRFSFVFVTLLFAAQMATAQSHLVDREIQSSSLAKSSIGTNPLRHVAVYLPSGYETSSRRYPVIYLLPNPTGSYRADFDHHDAAALFDEAIVKRAMPESIVVAPDLTTPLGPSWYINSTATGNWDDFVVKELVPYIDTNFRTLSVSASRAVIGNFIGGYGALRLGMFHPDIFGTVYAMHPVGTGNGVQVMTSRPDWKLVQRVTSLEQMKDDGFSTLFLSMFQAFLPDPAKPPLFADFPVNNATEPLDISPERMTLLRSRFFIAELIPQNAAHLKSLRGLKIDWSRNDGIYDHVYANQAQTHVLNEYGIRHEAEEFNGYGEPYWGKDGRMMTDVFPFLAAHMVVN